MLPYNTPISSASQTPRLPLFASYSRLSSLAPRYRRRNCIALGARAFVPPPPFRVRLRPRVALHPVRACVHGGVRRVMASPRLRLHPVRACVKSASSLRQVCVKSDSVWACSAVCAVRHQRRTCALALADACLRVCAVCTTTRRTYAVCTTTPHIPAAPTQSAPSAPSLRANFPPLSSSFPPENWANYGVGGSLAEWFAFLAIGVPFAGCGPNTHGWRTSRKQVRAARRGRDSPTGRKPQGLVGL